jgi:hypothetical protein
MAVCMTALVPLAPRARDAFAILAAQDEPSELADVGLNLAVRNDPSQVAENIEAALAADDADLANSFVELARDKGIVVSDELSKRVSDAVTDAGSASHFARRFATGLVTGNADDVASLSGTVAGDLFVFGDIRDVVREGKHMATGEEVDRLLLGLATVGLAVTAATYVSVGGVGPLRAKLRAALAARSPQMAKLATVDAVMEQALVAREHSLLATVPAMLEKRFKGLRQAALPAPDGAETDATPMAWLPVFHQDIRELLLAELDFRFQPVDGLLEALRSS